MTPTPVNMVPFKVEATIQYPKAITDFLSNYSVRSDTEIFFQEKDTGKRVSIREIEKFSNRRDVFYRLNEKTAYFKTKNDFNTEIDQRISVENLKVKKILSFQPQENENMDDRFIFVISFQQGKLENAIIEAFKDQVQVINHCSLEEIDNVILGIMTSNETMNRFTYSDVKFDAYFYNHAMNEVSGLCSVSGQEVWFKIRCFKCN